VTASVSNPHAGVTPSGHVGLRIVIGVLGVAILVIGVVLLFNPVAAAHTLALFIGAALVLGGLLEVAVGWAAGHRWSALVFGAILVIGGVLAAVWPKPTLFTLALVIGVALIVHGGVRVGVVLLDREELPGWGWLVLAAAVNIVVGVIVIAWPEATVRVLSLILGFQIVAFGLLLLVSAFVHPAEPATADPT
jgi:uncharacterized membrane protein HdeD (DUF308 family)